MITNIELIEYLVTLPSDQIVVLAADAEGNSFSPLDLMESAPYEPESPRSGSTYLTREEVQRRIDNNEMGWSEDDFPPADLDEVTVLWPTI